MAREKQADKIKRLEEELSKAQSENNCLQHILRQRVVLTNVRDAATVVRGPRTSAWIVLTAHDESDAGPRITGIVPIWDIALMRRVRESLDQSVQSTMSWCPREGSLERVERDEELEARVALREEYDRAMRELGVTP